MTTVTATHAARELIRQLKDEHGPVCLHVSGSYGITVVCLKENELSIGVRDVPIGAIDGVRLYLMTSEIDYWRGSDIIVDVSTGVGTGFSLEAPRHMHFTLRKRAAPTKRNWDANAILAAGPPAVIRNRDTST